MARDRQSWYLTWGGNLGAEEIWQTGVHLAVHPGAALPDPNQSDVDDAAAIVETFHTHMDSNISQEVGLRWVRLARQDTTGAEMGAAMVHENSSALPGATANPAGPFQNALVISLRTGSTFGRANYGRCYLPGFISAYTLGRYTGVNRLQTLGRFATMLGGLNQWAQDDAGPGALNGFVVSNLSAVGAGTTKQVTQVLAGDVPDTQRRRRNALNESYIMEGVGS